MAETTSKMIALGTSAPVFTLQDTITGTYYSLEELKGDKATVIMFICNHCPYVIHVIEQLIILSTDYIIKGVSFTAISSNDVISYPQDSPGKMREFGKKYGLSFPYLFDESQDIARGYGAVCTPDFFIFDEELKLVYRGQLDDSRPGNNIPVSGRDIRDALDRIIAGENVDPVQHPSIGCNIKWKI